MTYRLNLRGAVPAKKNSKHSWRGRVVIDPANRAAMDSLEWQARTQWNSAANAPANHPRVSMLFVCRHGRGDADGQATTVLDCLKRAGVIVDDNRRRLRSPLVVAWRIDPDAEERTIVHIREAA